MGRHQWAGHSNPSNPSEEAGKEELLLLDWCRKTNIWIKAAVCGLILTLLDKNPIITFENIVMEVPILFGQSQATSERGHSYWWINVPVPICGERPTQGQHPSRKGRSPNINNYRHSRATLLSCLHPELVSTGGGWTSSSSQPGERDQANRTTSSAKSLRSLFKSRDFTPGTTINVGDILQVVGAFSSLEWPWLAL